MQSFKNFKFPGKLVEISRVPQVEDDRPFMTSQKKICFLENVALKSLNYHCVHIDQLGLIQPTSIDSHSTCKQMHRHSVPRYCSVCKNEILNECKTDGSRKSSPRSGKFSRLLLP